MLDQINKFEEVEIIELSLEETEDVSGGDCSPGTPEEDLYCKGR
jgi:hypothetical protein